MKSNSNTARNRVRQSRCSLLGMVALVLLLGASTIAFAAEKDAAAPAAKPVAKATHKAKLHTYIIERDIPGAGSFSKEKLKEISAKSNSVLKEMGPDIQWVDSYVTDDKVYCVYRATNADLIREHAKLGGFPADKISEVKTVIDPSTGK